MNIFGAFTFGGLIKTFLPGFVWLIAIAILEADITQAHGASPFILNYAKTHDQAALLLSIPVSILLGLLSNIVVFMGVNDFLVRDPVKKANPRLFALYDSLTAKIRDRCWKGAGLEDEEGRKEFDRHADAELIVLPTVGADKLAYIREQYWYHLEFQINLLLSVVVLFAALAVRSWLNVSSFSAFVIHLLSYSILAGLVCVLLVRAARKNYHRHIAKMMSLMASILSPKAQESPCD